MQTFDPNKFFTFNLHESGVLLDLSGDEFPTIIHAIVTSEMRTFRNPGSTLYGMVVGYEAEIQVHGWPEAIILPPGAFFRLCSEEIHLETMDGQLLVIERLATRGYNTFGGPLEEKGRLKYVNGCSDSLILPPEKKGEPCLNHLHIPPGINQTFHDHPSNRIGIIHQGSGFCLTPQVFWREDGSVSPRPDADVSERNIDPDKAVGWDRHELTAGMGWMIPAGLIHSFHTAADGPALDVTAWHPETDMGPTDEHHPMVSRTMIDGKKASEFSEILTTEIG